MHPVLFKLGSFELRSYGLMLLIGVLVAAEIARRRAPRFGLQAVAIWDSAMWLVLPGILGARLVYILQNWPYYERHQAELFSLRFEGLTSFGGLLFGFIGFLLWQRRSGVPFWGYLDAVSVPVLVAQAIGRIGCLLNGCCYGRPTREWYGVTVQGLEGRHTPAQLVDFALMLVGALALTLWERRRQAPAGVSFGIFMIAYGLSRFVYEFFRAGTKEEVASGVASSAYLSGLPITLAQVTCLALVAIGIGLALIRSKANMPQNEPSPA